MFFGKTFKINT